MRAPNIITAAAACGAAAFLWALASARPPSRPWRTPRVGVNARPLESRPADLEGLEGFVRRFSEDPEAWFSLAELRRNSGNLGGERDAWKEVRTLAAAQTERQREDPRSWFLLAWASDKLRDPDAIAAWTQARAMYESRATGSRAANWRLWNRLGWARARTGSPDAARQAWDHAVELLKAQGSGGEDRDRSRHLLRNLALAGRTDEALELLDRTTGFWDSAELANDESLDPIRLNDRFRAAALNAPPPGRIMEAR